jgi:hypothetical protein
MIKLLNVFIFICLSLSIAAQKDSTKTCDGLLKGFISDGQEYSLQNNSNHISRIDIIFYPDFSYRIILCCTPPNPKFEIKLTDEHGNTQYSTNNFKNGLVRDFEFESIFHGQIIVKELSDVNISAKILIGYKKID